MEPGRLLHKHGPGLFYGMHDVLVVVVGAQFIMRFPIGEVRAGMGRGSIREHAMATGRRFSMGKMCVC